eukprot:TRINITY_DN13314_c0_g2_i1.p1 TRINITY_DN13314_c0_g2~~TRINITY_DN13314_c0_g2_i1.p1  ORF type:complete len:407 (+),score=104.93 TRINITY_DN13314_c0_g2_i1:197-1417(+)
MAALAASASPWLVGAATGHHLTSPTLSPAPQQQRMRRYAAPPSTPPPYPLSPPPAPRGGPRTQEALRRRATLLQCVNAAVGSLSARAAAGRTPAPAPAATPVTPITPVAVAVARPLVVCSPVAARAVAVARPVRPEWRPPPPPQRPPPQPVDSDSVFAAAGTQEPRRWRRVSCAQLTATPPSAPLPALEPPPAPAVTPPAATRQDTGIATLPPLEVTAVESVVSAPPQQPVREHAADGALSAWYRRAPLISFADASRSLSPLPLRSPGHANPPPSRATSTPTPAASSPSQPDPPPPPPDPPARVPRRAPRRVVRRDVGRGVAPTRSRKKTGLSSVHAVQAWLVDAGLAPLCRPFLSEEIDRRALPLIGYDDLVAMGVDSHDLRAAFLRTRDAYLRGGPLSPSGVEV